MLQVAPQAIQPPNDDGIHLPPPGIRHESRCFTTSAIIGRCKDVIAGRSASDTVAGGTELGSKCLADADMQGGEALPFAGEPPPVRTCGVTSV